MDIIKFRDVWEMYRIKFIIDGKASWENFWALKDINFKIEKGETVGIIGENGAGKSTILKLIAGILKPDRGEITVSGRVSGLLELGAGFQPELTGRENIYLNAGLFGLSQNEIEKEYEEIVSFANIGKFINAPVKCYSQGMFIRLAFAIAIHMDPDILVIDDTLAVGDEHFQRKCIKKIFEIKEQGKAIIFVTHDMNMLNRLCKRAIFFKEGRIVKDDTVDKVVPLFTQMVGTREGVGILEKSPLNLVFNNGRLFINWLDKLITPNSGAYASFLISGKWYSSLQADWNVTRESGNKLLAVGKFYQLALTQTWKLELTDNYEIRWDIEMDLQEPLEIQEGCTNIMLTNEYANWFTSSEKGKFPLIEEKNKNWQALLDSNISTRCIGVEANEVLNAEIPSLIFQQSNYTFATSGRILNADYLTNCRVLQYTTQGLQNYSATTTNRLIYFSGKVILDTPDINNYLNNLEDESILINGKLKLIFDTGRGILSYNGINLTKANHIGTSIFVNGIWYSSEISHWEMKKQSKDKMIVKCTWSNLPLIQIWEVEITSESSFLWKVGMKVNEELNIEQQHFYVAGCSDYTHWFSKYGTGKFPDIFSETNTDMVQRCIPDGEIGFLSQNSRLPVLNLEFSNEFKNFAKIFNSNFYSKARTLRIEKIEPERNVKFSPGEYPCFKLKITLNKDKRIRADNFNILEDKQLRFIFDNGSGRIFWAGKELTKRLGLYTSLRSQGRWYDSASSAVWKIYNKNDNIIKALGKWLFLPISQLWEMRLQEDRIIEVRVTMEVNKKIEFDRLQTNLMLSEIYSQWTKDKEKYYFPAFKNDIDDDWDVIHSEKDGIKYISIAESVEDKFIFPSITLFSRELETDYCLNIINSDIYHRGRVLQYLNSEGKIILPAEYPYFSGRIIVDRKPLCLKNE